jgi:hypothetical protein
MSDPVTAYPFQGEECPDPTNTLSGAPLPTLNGTDLTATEILDDAAVAAEILVDDEPINE